MSIDPKDRASLQAALASLDEQERERAKSYRPGDHLPQWTVLEKKRVPQPSKSGAPGAQFILVVEREGARREAVVSLSMWLEARLGDSVGLKSSQ